MVFKIQTLPKSVWEAIPNGDGPRNRRKPRPAPSWEARFRVRTAFLSIFGSNLGPRLASLGRLSADFRDFLANCGVTCDFSLLEGARGGSGGRFGSLGESPGKNFERILNDSMHCFGRSCPSIFVPISSQVWPNSRSVVVLPSVSHPCCPAFSCRGGGLAQRVKLKGEKEWKKAGKKGKKAGLKAGLINNINNKGFGKMKFQILGNFGFLKTWKMKK